MNALLIALALVCRCVPTSEDVRWNKDWKFRRPLSITNRLSRPLERGFTLQVEIDPDYLGIRDKSKAGLEDWALVRGALRIPFLLRPGPGRTVVLCFRTVEELRPAASDGYYLYYGAPDSTPTPVAQDQVFEFWEDFSRPEALAERFVTDNDLTASVQDGALVIREVAAGRTSTGPARITFKKFPQMAGFELSFDLEMDSSVAAAAGFAVTIDLKEPGANDRAIGKKVDDLIEKLGDDQWESREKATKELITIGRLAVARLTEALRATDVEVKWRADHILKVIRAKSPAPLISAGVEGGDPRMPVALTSSIGGLPNRLLHRAGFPVRTRIAVQRDPEGDIQIHWNGRLPQSGQMMGEIQQVAFTVYKASTAPLGSIRIDNIQVRRFVDEESKPTSTIDLEELRP
jgi:hypothetical protein